MKQDRKIYDCAIIGGGAAGLLCAVQLARKGLRVIIIEHTKRIGSKILQTGNGKCNFTNMKMDADCFQNEDKEHVMSVIGQFDNKAVIAFFESIGVYHRERNGYVYPHSDTAASLQNALRMELEHLKVRVSTEFETRRIKLDEGVYEIFSDAYTYYAYTVLLATGSKASPKSGSDGSGYTLAEQLGHHIVKPLPALVQLVSKQKECRLMAGVRSQGTVQLYVDDRLTAKDSGEIQYAEYGISGIPVFQISRFAVSAVEQGKSVRVRIDMLPDYSDDFAERLCKEGVERFGYKTVEQFFEGIVNKKLTAAAAQRLGIKESAKVKDLGLDKLQQCVKQLKNYEMVISGYKDFDSAQVCQGGVCLDEINIKNMMSYKKPGLFFAGELLDVDGKCGGYNLQWAWSSAAVAAKGIEDFLNNQKGQICLE